MALHKKRERDRESLGLPYGTLNTFLGLDFCKLGNIAVMVTPMSWFNYNTGQQQGE